MRGRQPPAPAGQGGRGQAVTVAVAVAVGGGRPGRGAAAEEAPTGLQQALTANGTFIQVCEEEKQVSATRGPPWPATASPRPQARDSGSLPQRTWPVGTGEPRPADQPLAARPAAAESRCHWVPLHTRDQRPHGEGHAATAWHRGEPCSAQRSRRRAAPVCAPRQQQAGPGEDARRSHRHSCSGTRGAGPGVQGGAGWVTADTGSPVPRPPLA